MNPGLFEGAELDPFIVRDKLVSVALVPTVERLTPAALAREVCDISSRARGDLEPDQEEWDGEFAGGYRFGADRKPLSPLNVEVLTVARGPSRLPRKPVQRSRPGFSNVTGPRWW